MTHEFPTLLSSCLRREGRVVELIGLADEAVGEFVRHFGGFPVGQAMLGDEAREEGAVDPARDVVPRRDRQKGARVVVEADRSEEPTSELQSLMRNSYAVFCLKKKKTQNTNP